MNQPATPLPLSRKEMEHLGWDQCDFIIITGDAYVDHPSFGAALIGRVLEDRGFKVGIIAQPDWKEVSSFQVLGRPRYAFMVTSGNLDSMVAHYTSNRKPRSEDAYSPNGEPHRRPDRAVITYTSRAKGAYRNIPVIIGGIEASLRRLAHYDYWSDTVRRSILLDSKADLLIYGMAERSVIEVAERLRQGEDIHSMTDIRGTVFRTHLSELAEYTKEGDMLLPDYQEVAAREVTSNTATDAGRQAYARSVAMRLLHENPLRPERLIERYQDALIVQNPPSTPLSTEELDRIYSLGYTRAAHPSYAIEGPIPALEEVRFSITSARGCFGGCTFCAITSHQGRIIQPRSARSIVEEARKLTNLEDFKGYIHDIGGPTANFREPACKRHLTAGPCDTRQCLFPSACPALEDSHLEYLEILREVRALAQVKKVFVRSGIRYDYLLRVASKEVRDRFIRELTAHHVSGQLKVAPEHVSDTVLSAMGKPGIDQFDEFTSLFMKENERQGKRQYIIPYFISAHPGSTLQDAIELACYLKAGKFIPDQVQDFYPTPGTIATCMYYTGLDPRPGNDMAEVYIPKGRERQLQRALLHFHKPENRVLVIEALKRAGRQDLIGNSPESLVSPRGSERQGRGKKRKGRH